MNSHIESGLRVVVSGLLAAVLTAAVMGGIGSGSGSAAARAAALDLTLASQPAVAAASVASQADAPVHLG